MYQTLYRAWRPQSFSDMVGQSAVVNTLKNQIITGHISHAYLFCGTRGTGKTSAARILSMAINCENPQNGDPCLKCQSCTTLQKDASLDVFEMDAASNSRVEEIREMLEKVNYPPQQAKYKVYIIDEVHMLSNAAFNALLKTLEEPPAYMVFILATTEPQKLPATILSRCQRFDFGRISKEDIAARLKLALKGKEFEESAVSLIAETAEGSMRDAWSLLDMCLQPGVALTEEHVRTSLGTVSREFLYDFFDAIKYKNMHSVFELTDKLMASGKDVQVFLRSFSQHIRDILQAHFDKESANDKRLIKQSQDISPIKLTILLEQCMKTETEAKWSSSPRTALEAFALRACLEGTDADDPLALAAKIEELEKQIEIFKTNGAEMPKAEVCKANDEKQTDSKTSDAGTVLELDSSNNKDNLKENIEGKNIDDSASKAADMPLSADSTDDAASSKTSSDETESSAASNEKQTDRKTADDNQTENSLNNAPNDNEKNSTDTHDASKKPEEEQNKTNPETAWNNMLKRAKKELISSYGIIQQGRYGGFTDGCYTLLFEPDKKTYIEYINYPETKSSIEKLLSEEFGSSVTFETKLIKNKFNKKDKQKQTQKDIDLLSEYVGRENVILKK